MINYENLKAMFRAPWRREVVTPYVTQDWIKQRMYYKADGHLIWLHCAENSAYWNNRYPGKVVGGTLRNGKATTMLMERHYYLHRLIWIYHNGNINPSDHVCHIGAKEDNRIENLRLLKRSNK